MPAYREPRFWSFGREKVHDAATLQWLKSDLEEANAFNQDLWQKVSSVLSEARGRLEAMGLDVKLIGYCPESPALWILDNEPPKDWQKEWAWFERWVCAIWEDRKQQSDRATRNARIIEKLKQDS